MSDTLWRENKTTVLFKSTAGLGNNYIGAYDLLPIEKFQNIITLLNFRPNSWNKFDWKLLKLKYVVSAQSAAEESAKSAK